AGSKLDESKRVSLNREDAQNAAAFAQTVVSAIAMQNDPRIVSSIRITQPTRGAVELRIKKCDETVAGDIAENQRVQSLAKAARREQRRGQTSHGRLQIRHQQRRRQSFPRHVCNADPKRFVREGE